MRTLVWFRGKELRVRDHAPLVDAAREGEVVPLFVLDPYFFAPERAAELPHRIQFLLGSLQELSEALSALGSRLIVVSGRSVEVVPEVAHKFRVDRVVAHRWTEPFGRERDRRIEAALQVPFHRYEGETLVPPGLVKNGTGHPYAVFTPYARALENVLKLERPLPTPHELPPLPPNVDQASEAIVDLRALGLTPNRFIATPGERAGRERLATFLESSAKHYAETRNRLDLDTTSHLSVDLKFGTVSVKTVLWEARSALERAPEALASFQNELFWREFSHHNLYFLPELLSTPFRRAWIGFPWRDDEAGWLAWAEGRTGYPAVDAAARQLVATGFVPNRARMIAASFLAKHLMIDFRRGEAHYMKWLTDGDWAQNDMNWQWVTGCGCDAAPYFRIFDPVAQGQRFDPTGAWVRKWVPELAGLASEDLHAPWKARPAALQHARVVLGKTYPEPIVDHATARKRFLTIAAEHLKGHSDRDPQAQPSRQRTLRQS